ncbi:hypothetical protein AS159_02610 [Thermotoga sp. Ku-13t]|nr:hypothetical protein AS159_02610 [Thermotoga sp. Ku-13t]
MIEYVKKFGSYSFGTWVAGVISFLSVPLLTYWIVPEEFGKASMFTLIYNIVYLVSLLGLDESYMRYYNVPEIKREQLFWDCLVPSATISLLFSF